MRPAVGRFAHTPALWAILVGTGILGLATTPQAGEVTDGTLRIGMCDASAAAALGDDRFIVANDEDNLLRVYRRDATPEPVQAFDANAFLGIDRSHPEADIEGVAAIGQRHYWITSHGRNRESKLRPNRYRFFATQWQLGENDRVVIQFVGTPYTRLLDDLLADRRLAKYDLRAASERAPKSHDALNIEGLAATPEGGLLIGFRNPVYQGKALVVPLDNPGEAIDRGRARLGDPIELDLGGLGIRSIEYWPSRKAYLIIAGDFDESDVFSAYAWSGKAHEAPERLDVNFGTLNPEGFVIYEDDSEQFQVVSDDGTRNVDGVQCKNNPDIRRRSFRTGWVAIP